MISGILLAAGESQRMGKPKLLLPWKNITIIEAVVDTYLRSKLTELIVVIGENKEKINRVLQSKPVTIVENPYYKQGMATSIRTGVLSASKQTDGYLIALADQPLITNEVIDLIISFFLKNRPGIAVPSYQGKRGHPVIFGRKFREDLCSLQGDTGGRIIIENNLAEVTQVEVESETIFVDIDTLNDYQKLTKP